MSFNSILNSINEFINIDTDMDARLQEAKDDLKQTYLFGFLFTLIIAGVCFGIMCLRFLVFGG